MSFAVIWTKSAKDLPGSSESASTQSQRMIFVAKKASSDGSRAEAVMGGAIVSPNCKASFESPSPGFRA